jgi:hypothetical protein
MRGAAAASALPCMGLIPTTRRFSGRFTAIKLACDPHTAFAATIFEEHVSPKADLSTLATSRSPPLFLAVVQWSHQNQSLTIMSTAGAEGNDACPSRQRTRFIRENTANPSFKIYNTPYPRRLHEVWSHWKVNPLLQG